MVLLMLYILSLSFALSQTFERAKLGRELKTLRQDFQRSEEFFTTKLSNFYGSYSADFDPSQTGRQEFVARTQNFANAGGADFR